MGIWNWHREEEDTRLIVIKRTYRNSIHKSYYLEYDHAIQFAKDIKLYTNFDYNNTTEDVVEKNSFISDGSVKGLEKGKKYFELYYDDFYTSPLDHYRLLYRVRV